MKWKREIPKRKDIVIGAILIFYFCMNCIDIWEKEKKMFHFTSASRLSFVPISWEGKNIKHNSFTKSVRVASQGSFAKIVPDRSFLFDGTVCVRAQPNVSNTRWQLQYVHVYFVLFFFSSKNNEIVASSLHRSHILRYGFPNCLMGFYTASLVSFCFLSTLCVS